jgi:hypothetical protein
MARLSSGCDFIRGAKHIQVSAGFDRVAIGPREILETSPIGGRPSARPYSTSRSGVDELISLPIWRFAAWGRTLELNADDDTAAPFINHTATLPPVSRHVMSLLPSQLMIRPILLPVAWHRGANRYAPADMPALFPAAFVAAFEASYVRADATRYFDVWRCRR